MNFNYIAQNQTHTTMKTPYILLIVLLFVSVDSVAQDIIINRITEIETQLIYPYSSEDDKNKGYIVIKGRQRNNQELKTFTFSFYEGEIKEPKVLRASNNSVYCRLPFSDYGHYRSLFSERRSRLSIRFVQNNNAVRVVLSR